MRIPQTKEALFSSLLEQMAFMEISSQSYDNGFQGEAKRLALTIRVLVHDTKNQTSLLASLGVKDKLRYFDFAHPIDETKSSGYICVRMKNTKSGWKYEANLGVPKHTTDFDDWWNRVLIFNPLENTRYIRKDIVLSLADMDGGGHVDPSLDPRYVRLAWGNTFGWEPNFMNGPTLPSVRQTANELELSLINQISLIRCLVFDPEV